MPKKSRKKKTSVNKKKQIKLLKTIVESLIGKQSVEIVDLLAGKKHINEFIIAKKLKLTINQTRNVLYKLLDHGLVSFTRKKDRKKGWYIYFWTLNPYQALNLLEDGLKKKLQEQEALLKNRRESNYYFCNNCSVEVNEETALLNNFICHECDGVYQLADNTKFIQEINDKITKLKKDVELASMEKSKEGTEIASKKFKKLEAAKRREAKKQKKPIKKIKKIKRYKNSRKTMKHKKIIKKIKTKKKR
ncbi:MAG: hypothetical protein AABW90_00605 [Nanoarchaeota archaeon]